MIMERCSPCLRSSTTHAQIILQPALRLPITCIFSFTILNLIVISYDSEFVSKIDETICFCPNIVENLVTNFKSEEKNIEAKIEQGAYTWSCCIGFDNSKIYFKSNRYLLNEMQVYSKDLQ